MVRLVLGPMSLSDFARFCPVDAVDAGPGPRPADKPQAAGRLRAWLKNYFNLELAWEARVVLKGSEVPGTKLGDGGRTGMGSRLGWTTWIGAAPKAGAPDRGDLVLRG
jgi:type VI secretion system protein ImpH